MAEILKGISAIYQNLTNKNGIFMKYLHNLLRTGLILLMVMLSVVFAFSQQTTIADPYAGSVVPDGNESGVCSNSSVRITVGNALGSSRSIEPGTVTWFINFPYDILIIGGTSLPAPFFELSRVCDPTTNEIRIEVQNNASIPFPTIANNFEGSQYFLDFPVTAVLPNISRQITVTATPIGQAGIAQGNLNPGNDNASSPIIFSPQACTQYRTKASGNWNDLSIWEVFNCPVRDEANCTLGASSWLDATTLPPSGAASVLISHDVVQNIDFTVVNCPLTLDDASGTSSKLTINPNITLGFNGGDDGNAYFNSRPVVVKSTEAGTGAIGRMLANSQTNGDDNVTVERYLPGEPQRRWNLLTFGVRGDATIREAWAGGSRKRVSNSQNAVDGVPLGTPPAPWNPKPDNVPFDAVDNGLPADYVPGDGTIITGHRFNNAAASNAVGYDWWPELIIPKNAIWWVDPTKSIKAGNEQTTPSSIRPYRPGEVSDFLSIKQQLKRGQSWVSNGDINTGFGGNGLINMKLSDAYDEEQAFMLFTRGDRKVLENWKGSTTLRPTGQLMKQSVSVPIAAGILNVVGNPFPAPVNFANIVTTHRAVINPYFFFWNSQLAGTNDHGAWEVIYEIAPFSNFYVRSTNIDPPFGPPSFPSNPTVISSSQGVMVEGTATGGNLVLTESMKAPITNVAILPFDEPSGNQMPGILFTNLNKRSSSTGDLRFVDAVNIVLADGFKEDATDQIDIKKINSHTGDLGLSLVRDEKLLMVEAHPSPTIEAVFPLLTPGLTERAFSFTFSVMNLYADGREVFLKDKFLNTLTPISTIESSEYQFEGTADTASLNDDRFEIVMKGSTILPVTFTRIHAEEINKDIRVNWGIQTEENMDRYEVEHSLNGIDFGKAVNVAAKNQSPASYDWLHVQPGTGDHFYRIRAFNKDGNSLTTQVVKVNIGGDKEGGFKVFPTVVTRAMDVNVQLLSLEKGRYTLQVLDMSGRTITTEVIQHNGGSAAMLLQLPASLSAGQYQIRLFNDKVNFVEPVFRNK